MTLGEKLRQARVAAGLSQRQLCGQHMTRNQLSMLENNHAMPSLETLYYLAGQLGKSVSYFLEGEQSRLLESAAFNWNEPEAALSPTRQLTLLGEMHQLVEQDSQFIVATHSPILMAYPGARIYELREDGIHPTTYQETEHYQLTRRFLENPERMLRYLLEM